MDQRIAFRIPFGAAVPSTQKEPVRNFALRSTQGRLLELPVREKYTIRGDAPLQPYSGKKRCDYRGHYQSNEQGLVDDLRRISQAG